MRIGSNILSLQAQHALERTSKAFARALERLASGKRINRAGDDAAGLAISTGLDSQVRGLKQAARNINDAFGFLNTAEGAIATQTEITQRMRELAMQAANGTYSDQDRRYLNSEFQSLLEEFNRISQQTSFNGTNLLDGNFETKSIQVGTNSEENISFSLASTEANAVFRENKFQGSYSQVQSVSTGTNSATRLPNLVDINGDGKLDLVLGDAYGDGAHNNIYVALGSGDGTFSSYATVYSSGGNQMKNIFTGDFDHDDKIDIIMATSNPQAFYFLHGNGNGTFSVTSSNSLPLVDRSTAIGDINGDGETDLVAVNTWTGSSISVSFGNGNGTFKPVITHLVPDTAFALTLGDFNHDGKEDIAYVTANPSAPTSNLVNIEMGNGDGTFQSAVTYNANTPTNFGPEEIQTTDLDGDGNLDLVTASNARIQIFYGNADGSFQAKQELAYDWFYGSIAFQDVNADGRVDIVAGGSTPSLEVYYQESDGGFAAGVSLGSGSEINASFGDINADGYDDMVSSSGVSGDLTRVYLADVENISAVPDLSISSQSAASDVLAILDTGLSYLNSQRAAIGAQQSRLESALSVTQSTTENLAQARSQILDTDFAEETAELTKQQILQQAGVSVMAQAQLQMQMVLSLLKNL